MEFIFGMCTFATDTLIINYCRQMYDRVFFPRLMMINSSFSHLIRRDVENDDELRLILRHFNREKKYSPIGDIWFRQKQKYSLSYS